MFFYKDMSFEADNDWYNCFWCSCSGLLTLIYLDSDWNINLIYSSAIICHKVYYMAVLVSGMLDELIELEKGWLQYLTVLPLISVPKSRFKRIWTSFKTKLFFL